MPSESDRVLRPLWFFEPSVLGHLHLPASPPADTAAIICATPFGYENICGHRSLRRLADRLASAGVPTLRFDVPGTGDSDGVQLLDTWLASIEAAVETVRRETGRSRVVVIGIGLGGTLAALAADAGVDVDGLVLWATPGKGGRWLREQRARHRVAVVNHDGDYPPPPDPPAGIEDVYGFAMTSALADALSAVDLAAPAEASWPVGRPRPDVLAVSRGARADTSQLAAALRTRGMAVEEQTHEGWDLMHDEPHLATVPEDAFAAILEWVLRSTSPGPDLPSQTVDPAAGAHTLIGGGAVEEVARYTPGDDGGLFSIACTPAGRPPKKIWLVFLTGRAVRHVGPNAMWVRFARELAREGYASLRLDGRSVGDSDGEGHGLMPNEEYYQSYIWDDIERVMDAVGVAGGAERFLLLGICSGATAAYEIAWRRDDVRAIIMLNPLQLKIDYEDYEREAVARTVRGVTNPRAWRRKKNYVRLLRGQVPVGKVLLAPVRRRRMSTVEVGDNYVVEGIHGLAGKGVEVDIFLSEGDGSVRFLERFAGRGLPGFERERLRVRRIPHSDHTLRQLYAQDQFRETLREALTRVSDAE